MKAFIPLCLTTVLAPGAVALRAQAPPAKPEASAAMLDEGLLPFEFQCPGFNLKFVKSSQTLASMKVRDTGGFDFLPADLLAQRHRDGYVHLGDLTLRLRSGKASAWKNMTTYEARKPVTALPVAKPEPAQPDFSQPFPFKSFPLAAADLAPTLPADCPLQVLRFWSSEQGRLTLRFQLKNKSAEPVEIGGLGIPMIFNNAVLDKELAEAHTVCSFADPYLGMDAGYLQVTRLVGKGPALVVVPDGKTPFEAYAPIFNPRRHPGEPERVFTDLTPRAQTFEGWMDWTVYSKAYGEGEWRNAQPWNPPTSLTLAPGESRTVGVKFLLAPEIRDIEKTLAENGRPVAVGLPGYVLPQDIDARLYLKYDKPVKSLEVAPKGALTWIADKNPPEGYAAFTLKGKTWGRSRLTVTYADGTQQTIHYDVTKPAAQVAADMGRFLTTKAWFTDAKDPFGRAPSVMTYDRDANQMLTQHPSAWVCGLGDEGGSTWLAEAMKLLGQPEPSEVAKFEEFVDKVVWGNLQYKEGPLKYGIKRTVFYYEPTLLPEGTYRPDINWKTWMAWNKKHIEEPSRTYNYPHVAALYWSLYRTARNTTGLVNKHPWQWYLDQSYHTIIGMFTHGTDYLEVGLMEGTVFVEILKDLKREGMIQEAADVEARMKHRADLWSKRDFPFGSEMAWDSTGQEEVYAWTSYFGDRVKAKACIDSIVGYMPTLPHWGYNGCVRRYWDFIYGGAKISRLERMIHHYGSSLNAIPVLAEYREHPDDFHLLRIGHAGSTASLTNIDAEGFPSMGFHTFPDTLKWDASSGDYGPNFFGHALTTGTYLARHREFGWQAFGGNAKVEGGKVKVQVLDAFRQRVYLAPAGLWLTLSAGKFETVEFDPDTFAVRITFAPADAHTKEARLHIEQPVRILGVGNYRPDPALKFEREAFVVPLQATSTRLQLKDDR